MKKLTVILIISLLVVTLVVARITAPSIITEVANEQIEKTQGISGQIEDIDLSIIRGAYKVKGLNLFLQENNQINQNKQDSIVQKPNIEVAEIDISILWSALFRGEIVSEVYIHDPILRFADEKERENDLNEEVKDSETWLTLIEFASPISVDKVVLNNARLELLNQADGTTQTNYIGELHGSIVNITNSRDFTGSKIADFELTGMVMGTAQAQISGSLNPDTKRPSFDVNFSMQRLPVDLVDDFVSFYTPLDVEKGNIDAAFEIVADNGKLDGYVKAGIFDADVFTWKQDIVKDDDSVLTGLFEGLVDGVVNLFESGEKDLIAVNVPISGTIDNTDVSTWAALRSLFYNAFINEYEIVVDDSFKLDQELNADNQEQSAQNKNHS